MKPTTYTPEEQEAILPAMPGLLLRPTPPAPSPEPPARLRRRPQAPRDRRLYDARRRLAESRAMLAAAHKRGAPGAIVEATRWVTHRTEGLSRLLMELGIDPATEELLHDT